MWGELLGLAFLVSLNPMLLGLILVVISRPRTVQNLLAFWVGALIVNVPAFLVSLFALHMVPSFASFAKDLTTADPDTSVKPLQFGTGVLALGIAALIAMRMRARRREPAPVASGTGGDAAVMVLETETSQPDSPPAGRLRRTIADIGSSLRRMLDGGKNAWENGALWVALVMGIGYMPPPPLVLLVDTLVVASGYSIGLQVMAVMVFIAVELALFEIALLSYLIAPARTQAVLEPVHRWAEAHRTQILIVLFGVLGFWQLLIGVGVI